MRFPDTTPADWLVLLLALAGIGSLYGHYWHGSAGDPYQAQVFSDGQTLHLDLRQAQTLSIEGPLGATLLQIHDGRVRFIASPCPGKQCIRSGWLHQAGDFAACLPNRVSVQIGAEPEFDSLVF